MLVAMSAREPTLQTELESSFGRAPYFILVDTETNEWRAVTNSAADASGGAGTRAARILIEAGAEALICGRVGPKASTALAAADIGMYRSDSGGLADVLDAFKTGSLSHI